MDSTPCCSVGGMASVASVVWAPCVGSLAPWPRLGRRVDCARGRGSVEAEVVLEAKGSGDGGCARNGARLRRRLRSRPGLSQSRDCARGRGSVEAEIVLEAKGPGETKIAPEAKGSGETEIAPEAKGSGEVLVYARAQSSPLFFFVAFFLLI